MNANQVVKQMELDLRTFAQKHPQQTQIVAERTDKLKIIKAELAEKSYLEAGLRLANDEIAKRKANGPLLAANLLLKQQIADKTELLRSFIEYPRTETPKKVSSLFLQFFLNIQLPALRKNPENIPALLKSGVLQKEAQHHPLLNDLIIQLKNLVK